MKGLKTTFAVAALGGAVAFVAVGRERLSGETSSGATAVPEALAAPVQAGGGIAPPAVTPERITPRAGTRSPPPLPWTERPARPWNVVRASYEFAASHPEVLRYVPCFCGCERRGHRSNEDCFVASRDEGGRVSWETHALTCGICLDVAQDAMRMHASGATADRIQVAIDTRYGPLYPSRTPTPRPPAG